MPEFELLISAHAEEISSMHRTLADHERPIDRIGAARHIYGHEVVNTGVIYIWLIKNQRETGLLGPDGQGSVDRQQVAKIFGRALATEMQKRSNQTLKGQENWLSGLFQTLNELTPYTEY